MANNRWFWGLGYVCSWSMLVACSSTDVMQSGEGGTDTQQEPPQGTQGDPNQLPAQSEIPVGPSEAIFEREHLIEVRVEMPPEDWDALRYEGIGMREILFPADGFADSPPYTHFSATVFVDGIQYQQVDIRKKGFIGSMTVIRPSFKLDFARNFDLPLEHGLRRMTLNNNLQDPSLIKQCLSYDLFSELGIAAPRCNFAHVVVNGEDLGTYTNIEPIEKPMLARHFADNSGNLYEGEVADFTSQLVTRMSLETNEKENDRSDLQRVLDALAKSDSEVAAALDRVLDLDSFFDFWALETLLGHWDSYSGNANNYYVYHDPTTDKFFFIPWGTDQIFAEKSGYDSRPYEITVYADGAVANRLYSIPEQRDRFRARLAQLNDQLWSVPKMLDRVETLSHLAPGASREQLTRIRSYVRAHGDDLRVALGQPAPVWQTPPSSTPLDGCTGTAGSLSGSFSTIWTDISIPSSAEEALSIFNAAPPAQIQLQLDGTPVESAFRGAAGEDQSGATLRFAAPLRDNWFVVVDLYMPIELFEAGYHPFMAFESYGLVHLFQPGAGYSTIGLIGDGAVQLDSASLEPNHAVSGSFTGVANYYACAATIIGAAAGQ